MIILAESVNCASRHDLTKVTYICGSLTGVQGTPGVLVGLPEASQKKKWSTFSSLQQIKKMLGEYDMLSGLFHHHPDIKYNAMIFVMLATKG